MKKNWYLILASNHKLMDVVFNTEENMRGLLPLHPEGSYYRVIHSRQQAVNMLLKNKDNEYSIKKIRTNSYIGLPQQTEEEIAKNPKRTNGSFVAVYSKGGIVYHVEQYKVLEIGIKNMMDHCKLYGFDPEEDDARIFQVRYNKGSIEVHSVPIEEYMSPQGEQVREKQ